MIYSFVFILDCLSTMGTQLHPANELLAIAENIGHDITDLEFAQYMDQHDKLHHLRNEFFYPKMKDLCHSKY